MQQRQLEHSEADGAKGRPVFASVESHLPGVGEEALLKEGEFVVKNLLLSIDPTQRHWLSEARGTGFVSQVPMDTVMKGGCIAQVLCSRNADFPAGCKTEGMTNWQTHCLCDAAHGRRLRRLPAEADEEVETGPAGGTALTAWCGMLQVCRPQAGEIALVSAAAGGTGVHAGQLAKIAGCYVVGVCGSDEKCRWLTEEMGFDAAVSYRRHSGTRALGKALRKAVEGLADGRRRTADVVFDNVGGEFLQAALNMLSTGARVAVCGAMANYQRDVPEGPANYQALAAAHASMTGFAVYHYRDKLPEARAQLRRWLEEGRLSRNTLAIWSGLDRAPHALVALYAGENFGKVAVRIGTAEDLPVTAVSRPAKLKAKL